MHLLYLSDQEVHVFLNKHVQLLLEDGLHLRFTLATQIRGSLADTPGHQTVTLIGHLASQVTRRLVDLGSLET